MILQKLRFSNAVRLLAFVTAASAVSLPALAKEKFEPFMAVAQISEVLSPSTDSKCPSKKDASGKDAPDVTAMMGTITGSGLSDEIGFFRISSVDCVLSDNPLGFAPPFSFRSASFVLTAANGDEIVISYSGTAAAELTIPGMLTLSGQFTILKGTGDFKKIKGSGTLTGGENIASNPAKGFVLLTGQISKN